MRGMYRLLLICFGAAVVIVAAVLISFAVLLQGSGLRDRVDEALSRSLGRSVTIQALSLSPWTGSATAKDLDIADDPAFPGAPFLHAHRVRLGIEILPLLLRRQVRIGSLALEEPSIRLLRNAAGTWNFTSLKRPQQTHTAAEAPRGLPDLAISSLAIEDGHLLVHIDPLAGSGRDARELRFDRLQFGVRDVDLTRPFKFDLSTALPANGTIALKGTAGPWNPADVAATPVSAQVRVRQLDLEAAGFVDRAAVSGVAGQFEDAAFDVTWQQGALNVTHLVLNSPRLTLGGRRTASAPAMQVTPAKPSFWRSLLRRLTVSDADVRRGTLTYLRQDGRPVILHDLELHLNGYSRESWTTYRASFVYGAHTTVGSNGRFRVPMMQPGEPARALEYASHVTFNQLDLAGSGLLSPGSPYSGVAGGEVALRGDSNGLDAQGSVQVDRLKLARNGQPYALPVTAGFHVRQHDDEGAVDQTTLSLSTGHPKIALAGTYRLGGPAALVDLHASTNAMPIDEIEGFLPTLGVTLPEGSRLTGGTLTTSLAIAGAASNLAISGPVRLDGTRLMGFDLGSKLASLARFTGGRLGSAASPGTSLRMLSLNLRTGGGQIVADEIKADIGGIGMATGSGVVGEGASLNFKLSLKLNELISGVSGGEGLARDLASQLPGQWATRALGAIDYLTQGPMKNGVPILIGGTAKHPTVTPNLGVFIPAERPRR